LIEADRRGIDSHGLGRLKPIYCDRMDQGILWPDKPIQVLKETETTALVDGNLGLGLYIGPHCMQMAIDKAKKHGVGFVAVKNSTHYGIAGYYVTMATQAGCIGLSGTNARPSIAPTFGVEPMLGTNPLCFGIPSDDEFPFVIDCATSINQRGKIEKYAREGVDTPKGVVVDEFGVERTDTEGILKVMVLGKCALNPVGGAGDKTAGYKGKICERAMVHLNSEEVCFLQAPLSYFRLRLGNCGRATVDCLSVWSIWRRRLWRGSCYGRKETNAVGAFLFGN